jgi:hypothetical protein
MHFIEYFPCTTEEATMEAHTSFKRKPNQQKLAALVKLSTTQK